MHAEWNSEPAITNSLFQTAALLQQSWLEIIYQNFFKS